jgi:dephospho-CoA kinase
MSKIILGFIGPLASGKDVSKKYLAEKYGASGHRFSTMLRDILNRLYLPITRANMQNLSSDLRRRFGSDTMARVIGEDVKNDNHDIIVVEGIRRLADIITLKDFPNFYLISLDADPRIRYDRLVKRSENVGDATKTYEEFLADHDKEAEAEVPAVMKTAKYKIDNSGTLTDLYAQIDKIISLIKKDHE